MIKEHTITTVGKERGETQEHIDICRNCKFPASFCNGECDYYKGQAKKIRQENRKKKRVITY